VVKNVNSSPASGRKLNRDDQISLRTRDLPAPAMDIYSFGVGCEGPAFSFFNKDEMIGQLSIDFFIRYAAAEKSASTIPGYEMTYSVKRRVDGFGAGLNF